MAKLQTSERHYLSSFGNIRNMRSRFILKQKTFQNRFRYYKIQYNLNKSKNIKHFRKDNPKEFWKHLKNFDPKPVTKEKI